MYYTYADYNPILDTDGYKLSHARQYPPDTRTVFSYIEARGGKFPSTLFFGLQYYLKEFLSRPVTWEHLEEAETLLAGYAHFDKNRWEYIIKEHKGYLPLIIRAVPEGRVIPTGNLLVSVENIDPNCYWLTSYIEPSILRTVWYGTTVATLSYHIKQMIQRYFDKTASEESYKSIPYRLHDFGGRGVSSYESAGIGGAGHLVNFCGTDTIPAIKVAAKYYSGYNIAKTVPAMEHSSVTTWGRYGENAAYSNMLEHFGSKGNALAVVVDSYDMDNAVRNIIGTKMRWAIQEFGGTLVVRPDSGKPSEVVLHVLNILGEQFGFSLNKKGYKVLPNCVRVLQGDGINYESIREIYETIINNGWSAENIFLGMGGKLLQGVDRDTSEFAMKCSAACIGTNWVDVYKDPLTSSKKKSKKGIIGCYADANGFKTIRVSEATSDDVRYDRIVYDQGMLLMDYTMEDIQMTSSIHP